MSDRGIAVLAIDRMIMVLRPGRDFMFEIGVKPAMSQIRKVEDEIFVFAGIELVAAEAAEQNVVALFGNRFRQQKMRQPGRSSDRFVMSAHHLPHHIEQIEILDRYRLPSAD